MKQIIQFFLFIFFVLSFFILSCKKDDETTKTDISVSARTDFLIWRNPSNLNQLLNEIITYDYGDAKQSEVNKSTIINNDTTLVTVSINFKEEFQKIYYDPELSNNVLTIHLQKNTFTTNLPPIPSNYNSIPVSQTPPAAAGTLPNNYELDMPPAGYQGQYQGSCSAWAVAYGMQSYYRKHEFNLSYESNGTLNEFTVCSPSYIFNQLKVNCRRGIQIKDALDMLMTQGVSSLLEMPYDPNSCDALPDQQTINNAVVNKIINYSTVPINTESIKNEIYAHHPVVIAAHLHDGFYSPTLINGNYVWTQTNNGNAVPGANHAMVVYGWNDDLNAFKVLNSWGSSFFNDGSIWIGYEIFDNYNIIYQAYQATNDISNSEITVNPTSLTFPNTQINTTSSQLSFTVSNTGTSSFSITGFYVPNGFTLINGQSTTIYPNSSVTFYVTFNPTNVQSYSGVLEVLNTADNASSSSSTIYLSGNGVNNNSSNISLSGNLNFGNVEIGQSPTRTFTISNTGNQTLNVSDINFPYNVYSANWTNGSIAPNNSQTVTVTFQPTNQQSYNGNVEVISDASSGNNTIAISGTGYVNSTSNISLSGNLNFGNLPIGQTDTRTFTISNTGNQSFYVSSINFPYSVYSANWNSGTINPNNSQTVTVTFQPTNQQSYNGNVTVNSNATNGNNTIPISGTGINTGQPNLVYSDYRIEIDDNNNGIVEAGEDIDFDIEVHNIGNADAHNVDVYFDTNNPYIYIIEHSQGYGTVSQGSYDWNSGNLNFEVDTNCPSGPVYFTAHFTSDEGSWDDNFSIDVQAQSGNNPIPITPSNTCSGAPIMQVNTEYVVNINVSNYTFGNPIDGHSYGGNSVRGFWLRFDVPDNYSGAHSVLIYDVSNNFDPVAGIKGNCYGNYLGLFHDSSLPNFVDQNGYGGAETATTNMPGVGTGLSNDNDYYIRIYHYYGNETPNISFKIKIE